MEPAKLGPSEVGIEVRIDRIVDTVEVREHGTIGSVHNVPPRMTLHTHDEEAVLALPNSNLSSCDGVTLRGTRNKHTTAVMAHRCTA